jgi:hypothetical protein
MFYSAGTKGTAFLLACSEECVAQLDDLLVLIHRCSMRNVADVVTYELHMSGRHTKYENYGN